MKLGLILNVIDPSIGGVLIMGHRGTGKSTAVRGLAELLPESWVVRECLYRCDPADEKNLCSQCRERLAAGMKLQRDRSDVPVVDLPLGATEDRVCGTIDIARALGEGVRAFEPGLLARANRGFLYIDEVNLLEDHLVDLLLDVAVTGRNKVERESISIEHPARFVLIGSGNPEEGELRPQLLDRFGLHVEVKTENDLDARVEIVERREDFERSPDSFRTNLSRDQQTLRNKITRAQKNFGTVNLGRPLLKKVAELCADLKIDGHRGELTIARAARALAALEGRKKATAEDVKRVATMSLRHRLRRDPIEETAGAERIQQALDRVFAADQPGEKRDRGPKSRDDDEDDGAKGTVTVRTREESVRNGAHARSGSASASGKHGADTQPKLSPARTFETALMPQAGRDERGRVNRLQSRSILQRSQRQGLVKHFTYNSQRGRYARATSLRKKAARIAVDATLRAFASSRCQMSVAEPGSTAGQRGVPDRSSALSSAGLLPRRRIPGHALRFKELSQKSGRLFIFAVDASGSMALNRISQAKGVVLNLLRRSYIRRDSVALVGFRGTSAEVLLPPSRSMLRARRALDSFDVGGGTPLSAGLACSLALIKRARQQHGEIVLLLFTDGHANVSLRAEGNGDRVQRRTLIGREVAGLGAELNKAGVRTIVVDTRAGFAAKDDLQALALKLGAEYKCLQLQLRPSNQSSLCLGRDE